MEHWNTTGTINVLILLKLLTEQKGTIAETERKHDSKFDQCME